MMCHKLISFQIHSFDEIIHLCWIQGMFEDFFGLDDGPGPDHRTGLQPACAHARASSTPGMTIPS